MKNEKFLLKSKLVNDIRIHQPRSSREEIYAFPKGYQMIGTRYALKLREIKFLIQGNHLFNVYFNPELSVGEILFADENKWNPVGKGFQDVEIGVNPSKFNPLSDKEKNEFIVQHITKMFTEVNKRYKLDLKALKQVESIILESGEDMEFVYKIKETQKYKVIISYQVKLPNEAKAFITYIDKQNNNSSGKVTVPTQLFEDIFYLAGSIQVKDSMVTLKSRDSHISQVYTKRYELPMKISAETYQVILEV
ncbi:MAG: hypothetical protein A2857_05420 [Candidatus Levybacteria bacterium RIFCSPHIGHO2_01_FULL_36_15]|nr:MAG: hypothetical protein A2857_05420 [Candidatus Levybacteria bacterium RIFCSPHIGHO2_01_FULL_36_15]OGH38492.1 MAG: hypothetical protein A2905_01950 [Candidatus Levybacteria bacterium RIFCSPLOWO2_01_FULL_36_10]